MPLFGLGYGKIETLFFLHREMIRTLDVVFSGYKTGEFRFIPPDTLICDKYQILYDRYYELFDDQDVKDYLNRKDITLTGVYIFPSLIEKFDTKIELWNQFSKRLLQEKAIFESPRYSDDPVQKSIKLTAYELQKLLPPHQQKKDAYFQTFVITKESRAKKSKDKIVSIDPNKGKLHLYGEDIDISPNSQEFKFLRPLLEKPGERILWKEHAQKIGLNIINYSDTDIARLVQDMKTKLRVKLRDLGVNKRKITKLCNQIMAVRRDGYKFQPSR